MPKPRYTQVSLQATPYYHCISRCVRRAFLCGGDQVSGQNYEHRRQWIEDKLYQLVEVFALDLCAYAVMSNHYHVVLHVDVEQAHNWNRDEVIERWHRLFKGHVLSQRYLQKAPLGKAELQVLDDMVRIWRARLIDISWFMRVLNESIARQANEEDGCSGRFWEGRFKSQALLGEAALAACMAYVDLNPIRVKLAETPELSDYTSIQQRSRQVQLAYQPNHSHQQANRLMPFIGNPRQNMAKGLPFRLTDYLELVDWSGRILREDKRGAINQQLPDILTRLNIEPQYWVYLTQHFESRFKSLVGTAYKLRQTCKALGYQRTPGIKSCLKYFPSG
ncbi:MAG: transposase [Gammaproteobacteria bacterium]|nr:transposase [Gammaproteobacteria bacterium]